MATVIQFSDGRAAYTPSAIASRLFELIATEIENESEIVARWLRDKALRPAPFMDIDLGSVEKAAADGFTAGLTILMSRQDRYKDDEDVLALGKKLLEMYSRVIAGEPSNSMSDYDHPLPKRTAENLAEIWHD